MKLNVICLQTLNPIWDEEFIFRVNIYALQRIVRDIRRDFCEKLP